MRVFAVLALLYLAIGLLIAFLSRDQDLYVFVELAKGSVEVIVLFWRWVAGVIVLVLLGYIWGRTTIESQGSRAILYAIVGSFLFQAGFVVIKTSLPYIRPFFADGFFARLDLALHWGVDPYETTHAIAQYFPMEALLPVYLWIWLMPALYFPVLLAATDSDMRRTKRFMILFGLAWILLGNVMALGGLSVGPVFYDRLLGGVRFAGLTDVLNTGVVSTSQISMIQDFLWRVYTEHAQTTGSGISAFPSVHVGMATVLALYLWERSKWLSPIGFLFLLIIQFISVYSGYHYAIDGYVSFIVIYLAWALLLRRNRQNTGENHGDTKLEVN